MIRTAYSLKALREEIEEAQHLETCCSDYPYDKCGRDGSFPVPVPYCRLNVTIYIEELKKELSEYLEEVLVPRSTQL